jgi:(p)ppGpp synthase/HD superfamily hydrolase
MDWITFRPILLGKFTQGEIARIRRAFVVSKRKHAHQFRDDGTPYFLHLIRCACIAIQGGVRDVEIIILLILHDTVEDTKHHKTPFTVKDVTRAFGTHMGSRISWLTKHDHSPRGILTYWKVLHECKDHRTILAKVVDRIDNIETLQHIQSADRRERKLRETRLHFRRFIQWLRSDARIRNFQNEDARIQEIRVINNLHNRLKKALLVHRVHL